MLKNRGITFKLIFYILTSSSAILILILGYDYAVSRSYIKRMIERDATALTRIAVDKIEGILQSVEQVPQTIVSFLENGHYDEDGLNGILKEITENNGRLLGVGISFEPDMYKKGRHFFAPYCFMGDKEIKCKYLGSKEYDYFAEDWYLEAKKGGVPVWSKPYQDWGGAKRQLATYSVPFYRTINGEKVFQGVAQVDLSFQWLQKFISSVKFGKTGYGFLVSRDGKILTHPEDKTLVGQDLFNMAREYENQRLRDVTKEMKEGKGGYVSYKHFIDSSNNLLIYTPLGEGDWFLGVDFPREEMVSDLLEYDEMIIVMAVGGIVLLFIVTYFLANSLTRSLRSLDEKSKEIARGNFDFESPEIKSGDEVGRLAESFVVMRDSLKTHIDQLTEATAVKEKMLSELRIARNIQMSLVPRLTPKFLDDDRFDVAALLEPAREVGGDLYDFFFCGPDQLFVVIGDVSDKGVPAALLMAMTKTLIKAQAKGGSDIIDILGRLNKEIYNNNDTGAFVTVFYGFLDLNSGLFTFSNAGHHSPVLIENNGELRLLETFHGTAPGAIQNPVYKKETYQMKPGDLFFFYTDGVTEAFNDRGEMFEEERLLRLLEKNRMASARMLTNSVIDGVGLFIHKKERDDDITLLSLRYKPVEGDGTTMRVVLKNSLSEIPRLSERLTLFGQENHLSGESIGEINLVLEELFTNSVSYGFDKDVEGRVEIEAMIASKEIRIEMVDDGKAFDPLAFTPSDPDIPLDEMSVHGRGILLVTHLVDTMQYRRNTGRNIVVMTKKV